MRLMTSVAMALVLAAGAAAEANAQNPNPPEQSGQHGGGAPHGGGQHSGGQPAVGQHGGPNAPAGGPTSGRSPSPSQGGQAPSQTGGRQGSGPGGQPPAGPNTGAHGWSGGGNGPQAGFHGGGPGNGAQRTWRGDPGLHFQDHGMRDRDQGRGWYDPGRFAAHVWAGHRFHVVFWATPPGWYYQNWAYGMFLPAGWYAPDYYLDWSPWDLPAPPIGCEWIRQGPDAVLVDVYTGQVLSVYQGLFV